MGILFTIPMGFPFTIRWGFLFTITVGIQFTVSTYSIIIERSDIKTNTDFSSMHQKKTAKILWTQQKSF